MRLKPLFLICALALSPVVTVAESLPARIFETQVAQVTMEPAVFAAELQEFLPTAKISQTKNGQIEIGYTGPINANFARLIAENAPSIEPFSVLPGSVVALSIFLSPSADGSELRLMSQRQIDGTEGPVFEAAFGTALPEGATVLSEEDMPGTCTKMLVYQDAADAATSETRLQTLLDARGTPYVANADGTGTLLMGETPNCGIFVYIQPDPEAPTQSLVVVRLMEK